MDAGGADGGPRYARVLVDVEPDHLDRLFDYLVPDDLEHPLRVGSRVEVVFAGRKVRGVVEELADQTNVDPARLRPLRRVLGPHAWLTPDELAIAHWAGQRFAAPAAHVLAHALPSRVIAAERSATEAGWFPPGRAPRPEVGAVEEPDEDAWEVYGSAGQRLLEAAAEGDGAFYWRPAPGEDLGARLVELAGRTLAGGRDVLVVVPSPRSTAADALAEAFADVTVDLRGQPKQRRTYTAWLRSRTGQARVVIGEVGAAFWPLDRPGLFVVMEESNPALKARRSPYHHVREVALERARRADGCAVLVGLVPSAPAWRLLQHARIDPVIADREVERDRAPVVLLDERGSGPRTRLGRTAIQALRDALDAGRLGVVLTSRRGEGTALACSGCGHRLRCPRCAASVATLPGSRVGAVGCARCDFTSNGRPACAECGRQRFAPLAAGATRLGEELRRSFRDVPVVTLEGFDRTPPEPPAVVVTTRGSVFTDPPGDVGAVVLLGLDALLMRPALDAAEDAVRLMLTAAGWVAGAEPYGASDGAGPRVVLQTDDPAHHAARAIVSWDPGGFWRSEVPLRAELAFPPVGYAIRVDAESADPVAEDLERSVPPGDDVWGPLPQDGRVRFLLKSRDRVATVAALAPLRAAWSKAGLDVRVDVDPVDVL